MNEKQQIKVIKYRHKYTYFRDRSIVRMFMNSWLLFDYILKLKGN